jgi:hypothetical protein
MKLFFPLFGLLLLAPPAASSDLTKVDRTIAKEPRYQHVPKYLLAVFGKEAQSKVWIVFDSNSVYVDTDGTGDLTLPAKLLAKPSSTWKVNESQTVASYGPITVTERDGKTQHGLTIEVTLPNGALRLKVNGPRIQYTGGIDDGTLTATATPAEAPIVHFGGALSVLPGRRYWPDTALVWFTKIEYKPEWFLQTKLGTPGLGKGTTACVNPATTCFRPGSTEKLGPDGPQVEIVYYRSDGKAVPFLAKHQMSLTCCAGIYTTTAQPPQDFDRARLTFTFPGSSEGLLESKTTEVELEHAKVKN